MIQMVFTAGSFGREIGLPPGRLDGPAPFPAGTGQSVGCHWNLTIGVVK
jgi:hypothetical protein